MIQIEHGDMREVLASLKSDGLLVDSVVTDPPYHLQSIVKRFGAPNAKPARVAKTGAYARASRGFMGKKWDGGAIAFQPETWRLCFDLLPPGGHLVAFAGTRTYHRMACAIDDAGFEIRDMVAWLYGSGFPKSHSVAKGLGKAGKAYAARQWQGWGTALKPALEPICVARKPLAKGKTVAGNVEAHGAGALNIEACKVGSETTTTTRNGQSGGNIYGRDSRVFARENSPGRWPANVVHDGSREVAEHFPDAVDAGSAARFFYSAKADASDRLASKHPTIKPVDLMAWLVRLVTPPKGLVLDPFAGSGATGMACMREGFDCIMVEREAEYLADIRRRLAHVHGADTPLFASPES